MIGSTCKYIIHFVAEQIHDLIEIESIFPQNKWGNPTINKKNPQSNEEHSPGKTGR